MPRVYAVRGATTAKANTPEAIFSATEELLTEVMHRNDLKVEDLISGIFTVTPDLTAAFPAAAARKLGWNDVPMMCAQEIPVPGSLPHCVRVLLHVMAENKPQAVYMHDARQLRPDLA